MAASKKRKGSTKPVDPNDPNAEAPEEEQMLLLNADQICQMWTTVGGDEEQFRSLFQLTAEVGDQQEDEPQSGAASQAQRQPVIS